MKILMLSQGRQISDQPDFDSSLRNAITRGEHVEVLNIPYVSYIEQHGCSAFYNEVVRASSEFHPDLVFFQFFHSGHMEDPTACIEALRRKKRAPLVFGSIGDLFDTGIFKRLGVPLPNHTLQLASVADAFFSTSMGNIADELLAHNAKNVVLLPNAFCPMHFPDWDSPIDSIFDKGVVMVGSRGRLISRHPKRAIGNAWRRLSVVKTLTKEFGENFNVYGAGWKLSSWAGFCPPLEQVRLYRRSRVVVDAPAPIINTTYYSSDRAFFILGSGAPFVFFHTPRFENIFRSGEHALFVHNKRELIDACKCGLALTEEQRVYRWRKCIEFVKGRHLISHRMDTLLSVYESLRQIRTGKVSVDGGLECLRLWHFLPEVDLNEERRYAIANWQG